MEDNSKIFKVQNDRHLKCCQEYGYGSFHFHCYPATHISLIKINSKLFSTPP